MPTTLFTAEHLGAREAIEEWQRRAVDRQNQLVEPKNFNHTEITINGKTISEKTLEKFRQKLKDILFGENSVFSKVVYPPDADEVCQYVESSNGNEIISCFLSALTPSVAIQTENGKKRAFVTPRDSYDYKIEWVFDQHKLSRLQANIVINVFSMTVGQDSYCLQNDCAVKATNQKKKTPLLKINVCIETGKITCSPANATSVYASMRSLMGLKVNSITLLTDANNLTITPGQNIAAMKQEQQQEDEVIKRQIFKKINDSVRIQTESHNAAVPVVVEQGEITRVEHDDKTKTIKISGAVTVFRAIRLDDRKRFFYSAEGQRLMFFSYDAPSSTPEIPLLKFNAMVSYKDVVPAQSSAATSSTTLSSLSTREFTVESLDEDKGSVFPEIIMIPEQNTAAYQAEQKQKREQAELERKSRENSQRAASQTWQRSAPLLPASFISAASSSLSQSSLPAPIAGLGVREIPPEKMQCHSFVSVDLEEIEISPTSSQIKKRGEKKTPSTFEVEDFIDEGLTFNSQRIEVEKGGLFTKRVTVSDSLEKILFLGLQLTNDEKTRILQLIKLSAGRRVVTDLKNSFIFQEVLRVIGVTVDGKKVNPHILDHNAYRYKINWLYDANPDSPLLQCAISVDIFLIHDDGKYYALSSDVNGQRVIEVDAGQAKKFNPGNNCLPLLQVEAVISPEDLSLGLEVNTFSILFSAENIRIIPTPVAMEKLGTVVPKRIEARAYSSDELKRSQAVQDWQKKILGDVSEAEFKKLADGVAKDVQNSFIFRAVRHSVAIEIGRETIKAAVLGGNAYTYKIEPNQGDDEKKITVNVFLFYDNGNYYALSSHESGQRIVQVKAIEAATFQPTKKNISVLQVEAVISRLPQQSSSSSTSTSASAPSIVVNSLKMSFSAENMTVLPGQNTPEFQDNRMAHEIERRNKAIEREINDSVKVKVSDLVGLQPVTVARAVFSIGENNDKKKTVEVTGQVLVFKYSKQRPLYLYGELDSSDKSFLVSDENEPVRKDENFLSLLTFKATVPYASFKVTPARVAATTTHVTSNKVTISMSSSFNENIVSIIPGQNTEAYKEAEKERLEEEKQVEKELRTSTVGIDPDKVQWGSLKSPPPLATSLQKTSTFGNRAKAEEEAAHQRVDNDQARKDRPIILTGALPLTSSDSGVAQANQGAIDSQPLLANAPLPQSNRVDREVSIGCCGFFSSNNLRRDGAVQQPADIIDLYEKIWYGTGVSATDVNRDNDDNDNDDVVEETNAHASRNEH